MREHAGNQAPGRLVGVGGLALLELSGGVEMRLQLGVVQDRPASSNAVEVLGVAAVVGVSGLGTPTEGGLDLSATGLAADAEYAVGVEGHALSALAPPSITLSPPA